MIRVRQGKVLAVIAGRRNFTEIVVQIPGEPKQKAYNYDLLTGSVETGDIVVLNTTAVSLKLGTGGAHFVMANLSRTVHDAGPAGHIMKLRYSPCQVKVLAAEEPDSPWAETIKNTTSLDDLPVVVGTLHSMLAPAAAGFKATAGDRTKVVYVMTDGAALPLPMSNLVHNLKATGLVDATITCGHAFGGDWECINIYTALLTAKTIARADVVIVAMGPGIVGTASPLGFTGVEQGEIINAVNILGGLPVAIPRISFADLRERHYGISHHTVTALGKIALTSCTVVLPELDDAGQHALLKEQLGRAWPDGKHSVVWENGRPALAELAGRGIKVTSMGRSPIDDPVFFLTAGAAGCYAAKGC